MDDETGLGAVVLVPLSYLSLLFDLKAETVARRLHVGRTAIKGIIRTLTKAGFTHADFVSRLKIFKISSKNRAKMCHQFTDFSKSEKSLH